jgi:hypothetical protein
MMATICLSETLVSVYISAWLEYAEQHPPQGPTFVVLEVAFTRYLSYTVPRGVTGLHGPRRI